LKAFTAILLIFDILHRNKETKRLFQLMLRNTNNRSILRKLASPANPTMSKDTILSLAPNGKAKVARQHSSFGFFGKCL
jgi:hypothetical protein